MCVVHPRSGLASFQQPHLLSISQHLRLHDEEIYRPPPNAGPYGWGTDWAVGVSVLHGKEDVINPPWCFAPENRSFVDHVMERRQFVDPYNKVSFNRIPCSCFEHFFGSLRPTWSFEVYSVSRVNLLTPWALSPVLGKPYYLRWRYRRRRGVTTYLEWMPLQALHPLPASTDLMTKVASYSGVIVTSVSLYTMLAHKT